MACRFSLLSLAALLACADLVVPVGPRQPPLARLANPGDTSSAVISFHSLAPGARLVVKYDSRGCFHDYQSEQTFVADSFGVSVTVTVQWPHQFVTRVPDHGAAVVRHVTTSERDQLDRVLELYRNNPGDGGCTTVTDIKIQEYRVGQLVRTEVYHDGGCIVHRAAFQVPSDAVSSNLFNFGALAAEALRASFLASR
jgi:hypothetical protein